MKKNELTLRETSLNHENDTDKTCDTNQSDKKKVTLGFVSKGIDWAYRAYKLYEMIKHLFI